MSDKKPNLSPKALEQSKELSFSMDKFYADYLGLIDKTLYKAFEHLNAGVNVFNIADRIKMSTYQNSTFARKILLDGVLIIEFRDGTEHSDYGYILIEHFLRDEVVKNLEQVRPYFIRTDVVSVH